MTGNARILFFGDLQLDSPAEDSLLDPDLAGLHDGDRLHNRPALRMEYRESSKTEQNNVHWGLGVKPGLF